jgi:hypothetical protein
MSTRYKGLPLPFHPRRRQAIRNHPPDKPEYQKTNGHSARVISREKLQSVSKHRLANRFATINLQISRLFDVGLFQITGIDN